MPVHNKKSVKKKEPTKTIKAEVIFELACKAYAEGYKKCDFSSMLSTVVNDIRASRTYCSKMTSTLEDMFNSNKSVEDFTRSYANCFSDLHVYQKHYCNTFKAGCDLLREYDENPAANKESNGFFSSRNFRMQTFKYSFITHFGYENIHILREIPEIEILNKWGAVYTQLEISKFTPSLSKLFEKYRSEDVLTVEMQREFFACLKQTFPGDPISAPSGTKRKTKKKLPAAKRPNIADPNASSSTSLTPGAGEKDLQKANHVGSFVDTDHHLFANVQPLFEDDQQLEAFLTLNLIAQNADQMPPNNSQSNLLNLDAMDVLREIENTSFQHTYNFNNNPHVLFSTQATGNQGNQSLYPSLEMKTQAEPIKFLDLLLSQTDAFSNNTHGFFNQEDQSELQPYSDLDAKNINTNFRQL